MKVQDLLTDDSRWTQGVAARTQAGRVVGVKHPEAVSWCLGGALAKCYGDAEEWRIMLGLLTQALGVYRVSEWNDDPARTFQDVRELVVRLDL